MLPGKEEGFVNSSVKGIRGKALGLFLKKSKLSKVSH